MMPTAATWKKWGVLVIVGLALLMIPAGAADTTTITATDVSQYSMSASYDHYIYQIIIDSLPIGTNQTHVLNSNGATFLLNIKSWNEYVIYNNFEVSMTYPNGTTEVIHALTTRVSDGTYKTTIQPIWSQLQSMTPAWKVDLIVSTNPTTVSFNSYVTSPGGVIPGSNTTQPIPFTSVSGEFSGQRTTVYAYEISKQGFQDEITDYNPFNTGIWGDFFKWTWSAVLGFFGMIPIIGPMFVTVMEFIYTIAAQMIFWIAYIITNSWLIIGGLEVLIAMMAFLLAGKRPTPERVVKKWVNYNVRAVKGFIYYVDILYHWLREFINTVANVVNGLKPI